MGARWGQSPPTRDHAFYAKVVRILGDAQRPILMDELRAVPELKKDLGRISSVIHCLHATRKIQLGYDANHFKVVASLDKPFPFNKELPDGRTRASTCQSVIKQGLVPIPVKNKIPPPEPEIAAAPAVETPPQEPSAVVPASPVPAAASPAIAIGTHLLDHSTLDAIAQKFADTIAAALCLRIVESLQVQLPAHIEHVASGYRNGYDKIEGKPGFNPPAPPRLRVAIAGLKPDQVSMINTEFGKALDISFIKSDEVSNSQRIKNLMQTSDTVYGMVNFMSHSLDQKLTTAMRYRRISGGMSSLRDHLRALIATAEEMQH